MNFFLFMLTTHMCIDTLRKGEISGNKDIDAVQRGVGDAVGNTFATGQAGGSVGHIVDRGALRSNM